MTSFHERLRRAADRAWQRTDEIKRLRAENSGLRAENASLRAEIAAADARTDATQQQFVEAARQVMAGRGAMKEEVKA